MIHFEQVWNKSELETKEISAQESKKIIKDYLQSNLDLDSVTFGAILLHLTNLSRIYQINTFTALQKAMEDYKISKLEIND
jgi:uncharacterized protein YabN with tetrapyrrole methylase and pyrophosphatase domain